MKNPVSDALASSALLPEPALVSALAHPDLLGALCARKDLPAHAWSALLDKDLDEDAAASLLGRELGEDLLAKALAKEHRSGPLEALVAKNHLGLARQEELMATPAWGPALALAMSENRTSAPELAYAVARASEGGVPLSWLLTATVEEIGDEDLARELLSVPHQSWRRLRHLLERRPGVLEHFKAPLVGAVASAMATSRLLHGHLDLVLDLSGRGPGSLGSALADASRTGNAANLLKAVVKNPYVTLAAVREVSERTARTALPGVSAAAQARLAEGFEVKDPADLTSDEVEVLVGKALPSLKNESRLWELPHLVRHPQLSGYLLHDVLDEYASSATPPSPALRAALEEVTGIFGMTLPEFGRVTAGFQPASGFDADFVFSWDLRPSILTSGTRAGAVSREQLMRELMHEPVEVFDNLWTLLDTFEGDLGELVGVCRDL